MTKKELNAIAVAARKAIRLKNREIAEAEKIKRAADQADSVNQTFLGKVLALETSTLLGITNTIKTHGVDYVTPPMFNTWARTIGQSIYDMGPVWSGYVSTKIKERVDAGEKFSQIRTPEHFFPRQIAGNSVVNHIIKYEGISRNHLLWMLGKFRMVHYVTSEENTALVPFQRSEVFEGWEVTYRQAGIVLVDYTTGESYCQHEGNLYGSSALTNLYGGA